MIARDCPRNFSLSLQALKPRTRISEYRAQDHRLETAACSALAARAPLKKIMRHRAGTSDPSQPVILPNRPFSNRFTHHDSRFTVHARSGRLLINPVRFRAAAPDQLSRAIHHHVVLEHPTHFSSREARCGPAPVDLVEE